MKIKIRSLKTQSMRLTFKSKTSVLYKMVSLTGRTVWVMNVYECIFLVKVIIGTVFFRVPKVTGVSVTSLIYDCKVSFIMDLRCISLLLLVCILLLIYLFWSKPVQSKLKIFILIRKWGISVTVCLMIKIECLRQSMKKKGFKLSSFFKTKSPRCRRITDVFYICIY